MSWSQCVSYLEVPLSMFVIYSDGAGDLAICGIPRPEEEAGAVHPDPLPPRPHPGQGHLAQDQNLWYEQFSNG